MSRQTTDAGKKGEWQELLGTMEANSTALAHLEPLRGRLATQLTRVLDLDKQQAGLIASKQELSKQLRVEITEGDRLATLLRSAIKQHFGIRAEKVAEFGVQPFRGRNRRKKGTPIPEPTTAPPATAPASTSK